ncbi:glutathione S-transferase family protein [Klebsiella grimontii]|uniref:glutathione S-transferase family protein n=1 Tax=Klebsiella grimontii TaxID=2058152 RepID=UPI001CCA7BEE|nr:glutathione S-transferase family protein [Klebsiella grimontii]MBZ7673392.1 glutathione S-transferase family protein [Klebsiella grimontii]
MIKLIGMMDSPYVRRVAISLELYGVEFESHPLSVFSSFDAFSRINPAVKAPTLVLDNGIRLMDSSLMLAYFEGQAAPARKLLPVDSLAQASDLQTLGFILAAGEKAVQNVYEHNLRPAEKQHNPWIERITIQLLAACREWNSLLENRPAAAVPDQVAVTSTVIWTFIQSMIPHVVHAGDFNHIQSAAQLYEAHSAFKKHPFG